MRFQRQLFSLVFFPATTQICAGTVTSSRKERYICSAGPMPNPPLICNVNGRFTSKPSSSRTFATIFGLGEYRVDGDAGGVHDLGINAELIQIDFRFRIGNEICFARLVEPHALHVVIGDNNNLRAMNCFFLTQHAQSYLRGQEMRAYR